MLSRRGFMGFLGGLAVLPGLGWLVSRGGDALPLTRPESLPAVPVMLRNERTGEMIQLDSARRILGVYRVVYYEGMRQEWEPLTPGAERWL